MKPCSVCGDLKPDEDFTVDVSRPDGLSIRCRDCNKAKCREWYQENRARVIARSQAYKAEHGRSERPTWRGEEDRRTRALVRQRLAEEPLSEYRLVKLSPSEEMFCLQMGERLGLKPDEFIRWLVKDAKYTAERALKTEED